MSVSRQRTALFVLFLLALLARGGYAALIYTPDLAAFETGDYALYRIGADHLLTQGNLVNSLFLVRPPLFPAWIALLGNNAHLVLAANLLFGAALAPLAVAFARLLHDDPRLPWLVGLIVACAPTPVLYSAFLGPEPLANLLLLLALTVLVRAAQPGAGAGWAIAAGALLIASAFVRPATYLFWIPLALWWILRERGAWRAVLRAAGFAAVCAIGVAAWTAHNAAWFATPSFSTVAPYTMVYYRAASVERIATDQPIDAVYVAINQRVVDYAGLDLAPVDEATRHNFLAAPPHVQQALNQVALEIFLAHPVETLITFPIGFARMYGMFPDQWTVWTIALAGFSLVFTAGAAIGVVIAARARRWTLLALTLLPILYYTGGTLLVKSAGMDTRERSMLEPMLAILCAITLLALWDRLKRRSTA